MSTNKGVGSKQEKGNLVVGVNESAAKNHEFEYIPLQVAALCSSNQISICCAFQALSQRFTQNMP